VAGVVLNKVGSDGHEALLRDALAPLDVPVLGVLRRDAAFAWRDRHLGLVPVVEQPDAVRRSLDVLAEAIAHGCDLDRIMQVAQAATATSTPELPDPPAARFVASCRIAVAGGPAFSFVYPDNLELLEQAGAELVPVDPLTDAALPADVTALYAGGGFPEVFAEQLAANRPLLADVRSRVADGGLVTWAECGGLLWLSRSLDAHTLAGVVPAEARMTDRLTLGYRTATVAADCPLAPAGAVLKGHEFHYSHCLPSGDALHLEGRFGQGRAGWASPTLLASYLHLHLAATPEVAERFVEMSSIGAPSHTGSRWKSGAVPPL
jgi:cobyrinic acid a,c-diamide synthase